MRAAWTQWLFNHKRYEHALSAAFEEPWPLSAERRSHRWIWIAKIDGFFNTILRPQKLVVCDEHRDRTRGPMATGV